MLRYCCTAVKFFLRIFLVCTFCLVLVSKSEILPSYNVNDLFEKFPDYGKTWMYFPDGNGVPQVAQLVVPTTLPKFNIIDDKSVTFYLYTRENTTSSQILKIGEPKSLNDSTIRMDRKTKVMIHGWMSKYTAETSQLIKDNLLTIENCNVILVNWEPIASNIIYPIPAIETKQVGERVAKMVDFLIENGAHLDDIHLIGHSLGAHIAGNAGAAVTNGKVARVTGLDPALPGFELVPGIDHRLDPTDAKFVDVIHTCGGILGYYGVLGHIDFYPNGGTLSQPGCFGLPQLIEACSHGRSWQYYAYSILHPQKFMATNCESWGQFLSGECSNNTQAVMGLSTPKNASGVYYLKIDLDAISDMLNVKKSLINLIPF